jgi:hypothetical protein
MISRLHTVQIPGLGQLWHEQGGHFAGVFKDPKGGLYGLIVPPKGIDQLGKLEWGSYGKTTKGADSLTDGLANTQAMLKAKSPAALALQGFEYEGFKDWYLGAKGEMVCAYMNCEEVFVECETYWTSSEYSADGAWCQNFGIGQTFMFEKDTELRLRPVRRLKI